VLELIAGEQPTCLPKRNGGFRDRYAGRGVGLCVERGVSRSMDNVHMSIRNALRICGSAARR